MARSSRSKKDILRSNTTIFGHAKRDSNSPSVSESEGSKVITVNARSKRYLSQENVTKFFNSVGNNKQQLKKVKEINEITSLLCPICNISLNGYDLPARNQHVNRCIEDGLDDEVANASEDESGRSSKVESIESEIIVISDDDVVEVNDFDDGKSENEDGIGLLDESQYIEDMFESNPDSKKFDRIDFNEPSDTQYDTMSQSNNISIADNKLVQSFSILEESNQISTKLKRTFSDSQPLETKAVTSLNKRTRTRAGALISIQSNASQLATVPTSTLSTPKKIPFFKIIEFNENKITVDAFNFGGIDNVQKYFLSHFHSDHYMGLNKSWKHGLVYCTPTTSRLIQMYLKVDPLIIREIPLNQKVKIDNLDVVFLDANHCPGSAIMLIAGYWNAKRKVILHTGDFRANEEHIQQINKWVPLLRDNSSNWIDAIYLDTTYLNPNYSFPKQYLVLNTCADYCFDMINKGEIPSYSKKKTIYSYFKPIIGTKRKIINPVIYVGSYTIGKERLAIHIANRLNCKIFAKSKKKQTLLALEDENLTNLLCDNGLEANVHIVSMHDLNIKGLQEQWEFLKKTFTHLLAFQPTGWTFKGGSNTTTSNNNNNNNNTTTSSSSSSSPSPPFSPLELENCRKMYGNIHIFRVPYSEHSSFNELEFFCKKTNTARIIPTVNTSNAQSRDKMNHFLNQWH